MKSFDYFNYIISPRMKQFELSKYECPLFLTYLIRDGEEFNNFEELNIQIISILKGRGGLKFGGGLSVSIEHL